MPPTSGRQSEWLCRAGGRAREEYRPYFALPTAEARVWLNDAPAESTSANRRFQSPPLEPGQSYSYRLRAQSVEDGRTVERSTKVLVQAGKQVQVDLTKVNTTKATVAATK
jgi:uncharacterized protein (TIGR03000 family)